MFSKTDPTEVQKRVRITLAMRSGEIETGSILIPAHHSLRQSLNDAGPFIEIETSAGRHSFLLKTEVARIDPIGGDDRPPSREGEVGARFDAKDARLVLGVGVDASHEELHAAWRELAKAYHPDRLAALGLPDALLRHADRILMQINTAYQRLKNGG
jgi:DnaJ-domain-containing protein 1